MKSHNVSLVYRDGIERLDDVPGYVIDNHNAQIIVSDDFLRLQFDQKVVAIAHFLDEDGHAPVRLNMPMQPQATVGIGVPGYINGVAGVHHADVDTTRSIKGDCHLFRPLLPLFLSYRKSLFPPFHRLPGATCHVLSSPLLNNASL